MLACARIGAPHTVVFGGFSAEALAGRIEDAQAKLLITADGGWRRGKAANLKTAADEAAAMSPTIEHVLVVKRIGDAGDVPIDDEGRPRRLVARHRRSPERALPAGRGRLASTCSTCSTRRGTTAKPKGIMHTTAGYLLGTAFTH